MKGLGGRLGWRVWRLWGGFEEEGLETEERERKRLDWWERGRREEGERRRF